MVGVEGITNLIRMDVSLGASDAMVEENLQIIQPTIIVLKFMTPSIWMEKLFILEEYTRGLSAVN